MLLQFVEFMRLANMWKFKICISQIISHQKDKNLPSQAAVIYKVIIVSSQRFPFFNVLNIFQTTTRTNCLISFLFQTLWWSTVHLDCFLCLLCATCSAFGPINAQGYIGAYSVSRYVYCRYRQQWCNVVIIRLFFLFPSEQ